MRIQLIHTAVDSKKSNGSHESGGGKPRTRRIRYVRIILLSQTVLIATHFSISIVQLQSEGPLPQSSFYQWPVGIHTSTLSVLFFSWCFVLFFSWCFLWQNVTVCSTRIVHLPPSGWPYWCAGWSTWRMAVRREHSHWRVCPISELVIMILDDYMFLQHWMVSCAVRRQDMAYTWDSVSWLLWLGLAQLCYSHHFETNRYKRRGHATHY